MITSTNFSVKIQYAQAKTNGRVPNRTELTCTQLYQTVTSRKKNKRYHTFTKTLVHYCTTSERYCKTNVRSVVVRLFLL